MVGCSADRTQPEVGCQTDGGESDRQPGSRIVEHGCQRKAEHQDDGFCPEILIGDGESDCRQKDGACDDCHRADFSARSPPGKYGRRKRRMLKPEATLRRRQVKTSCNIGSSPIDPQIALSMQTSCQPQTLKTSSDRGNVAACMAISSASRPFFGNRSSAWAHVFRPIRNWLELEQ